MSHAHDNTLLAKLGFADPDRKNPLHDMACQYLTQLDVVNQFLVRPVNPDEFDYQLETHIVKGQDRFATTIGFIDVRFGLNHNAIRINVEVKAHPATAGDVLRQIAFYRTYTAMNDHLYGGDWMLATCYPISNREATELRNAEIGHIQLSPDRIQVWAAKQDAVPYRALEV